MSKLIAVLVAGLFATSVFAADAPAPAAAPAAEAPAAAAAGCKASPLTDHQAIRLIDRHQPAEFCANRSVGRHRGGQIPSGFFGKEYFGVTGYNR